MTHDEAVSTLAAERYLLGEMADAEREAFEAHYFDCADCSEDVRLGATMAEGARLGLLPAPTARPLARPTRSASRWLRSPALPWALAATLAIVVAYQASPLRRSVATPSGAVALSPVTVRPATRGQETTVSVGSDDTVVTLAIDVPVTAPTGMLQYALRVEGARQVASGQVRAPQPGFPLLLLLPAHLLTPSTGYVLAVHDAATAGLTVTEYRFTVLAR